MFEINFIDLDPDPYSSQFVDPDDTINPDPHSIDFDIEIQNYSFAWVSIYCIIF